MVCSAISNTDNDATPVGTFAMSPLKWNDNKQKNWVFLYPKRDNKEGYWDYYCENPDNHRSKIALHPGQRTLGCVSIPDTDCWQNIENLFKQYESKPLVVHGSTHSGLWGIIDISCDSSVFDSVEKVESTVGTLTVTM